MNRELPYINRRIRRKQNLADRDLCSLYQLLDSLKAPTPYHGTFHATPTRVWIGDEVTAAACMQQLQGVWRLLDASTFCSNSHLKATQLLMLQMHAGRCVARASDRRKAPDMRKDLLSWIGCIINRLTGQTMTWATRNYVIRLTLIHAYIVYAIE